MQQLTECEHMDCSEEQNKECVETILVPDYYDPYGGENCPCICHNSQLVHCTSCGVKVRTKYENYTYMLSLNCLCVTDVKQRTKLTMCLSPIYITHCDIM